MTDDQTNILIKEIDRLQEDFDFYNQGIHTQAYRFLGAKKISNDQEAGYRFTVWAPRAAQVYVQGDFNHWHLSPMTATGSGFWVGIQEEAMEGQNYKYAIDNGRGHIEYKIDPYALKFEIPPKDAAIIYDIPDFKWEDSSWLNSRRHKKLYEHPINIYEVHKNSWRKHPDGRNYTFKELAESLIPYVKEMGYTHIEFMPLTDHPLEASWGYQITGYYAVAGAYGTLAEFQAFVNEAHKAGIGVFMDWVPGHFNRNANALAYYDGTPTYEYEDYNKANNISWGTLNFDLGKPQVQSFLTSSALFWIEECHLDGIRVDAVSNMLYLDFDQGPWTPNEDGTNIKKEGVRYLQYLNETIHDIYPDVLMMAEESTDWLGVTAPVEKGGLGFNYKWNMGWMNDTLKFFEMEPYIRPQNLRLITFVFMYQYNERYILPYSHDEVVHGKNSLLGKIPGDRYQQFATLRVILGYMLAQPGKVLNFMGNELGQFLEWRFYSELEWGDLQRPYNSEYHHFVKTAQQFVLATPAMYQLDHDPSGLVILDADDLDGGTLTMIRQGKKPRDFVIMSLNFVPVEYQNVRIGVPYRGQYEVALNSEMQEFGGNWTIPFPILKTEDVPHQGMDYSIVLTVPSLSVLYIKPKRVYNVKAK